MSNTEWNRQSGEYARWGEDVHPYHTFEEEEEDDEEEEYEEITDEEVFSSIYEEMLADASIHNTSLISDVMKLTVSAPPRLTISEGVPITFNYSDKATVTQEVTDGQLSFTVQENVALESIKICVGNRTWVIPLDTFPVFPPLMPKKR